MNDINPVELVRAANDGEGGFGGNGWWIILLFLFLGWGNNGWGNGGANEVYPIMENQQNLFTGFGNMQTAFANAETAAASRQMADMQQMFSLSQQLSQCCCENRLATANLQAALASEACADRQAVNEGVRDILANQTANTQAILSKLCDQDLEAARRENEQLRQQLAMANLAASQVAQTAQIIDALKPAAATA
jgi:hypothetical protein